MKQQHLVPILSVLPLVVALLVFTQYDVELHPLLTLGLALGYVVLNITYAVIKKTFQIHTLVEFVLVALIAYFALNLTI